MFSVAYVVALAALTIAQTPPSFNPSSNNNLGVNFNNSAVLPGALLSVNTPQSQPILSTTQYLNKTYTLLMIDPDAIFNGSSIAILHWVQQDLKFAPPSNLSDSLTRYTFSHPATALAPYIPPAPPAELPPRPHRYIQLLFTQPYNFSIPSSYTDILQTRVGLDLLSFVRDTGLGGPVAANYFLYKIRV